MAAVDARVLGVLVLVLLITGGWAAASSVAARIVRNGGFAEAVAGGSINDAGYSRERIRVFILIMTIIQTLAGIIALLTGVGPLAFFYIFFMLIVILLGRWHYLGRIVNEWDGLDPGGRWKLGLAAFFVPAIVGSLSVVGLVLLFVFFLIGGLGEAFAGNPLPGMGRMGNVVGAGLAGFRPRGANSGSSGAAHGGYGRWWGDEKVIYHADGTVERVGNDIVKYGPDGRVLLLGDRKVTYDSLGRIDLIGDEKVQYASGSSTPFMVGERRVR